MQIERILQLAAWLSWLISCSAAAGARCADPSQHLVKVEGVAKPFCMHALPCRRGRPSGCPSAQDVDITGARSLPAGSCCAPLADVGSIGCVRIELVQADRTRQRQCLDGFDTSDMDGESEAETSPDARWLSQVAARWLEAEEQPSGTGSGRNDTQLGNETQANSTTPSPSGSLDHATNVTSTSASTSEASSSNTDGCGGTIQVGDDCSDLIPTVFAAPSDLDFGDPATLTVAPQTASSTHSSPETWIPRVSNDVASILIFASAAAVAIVVGVLFLRPRRGDPEGETMISMDEIALAFSPQEPELQFMYERDTSVTAREDSPIDLSMER